MKTLSRMYFTCMTILIITGLAAIRAPVGSVWFEVGYTAAKLGGRLSLGYLFIFALWIVFGKENQSET